MLLVDALTISVWTVPATLLETTPLVPDIEMAPIAQAGAPGAQLAIGAEAANGAVAIPALAAAELADGVSGTMVAAFRVAAGAAAPEGESTGAAALSTLCFRDGSSLDTAAAFVAPLPASISTAGPFSETPLPFG